MEKIYLVYFLLFIINNIVRKGDRSILSCGLFGFVGDGKPDLNKLKILGLYNIERGKDSCGVYYDERVQIGVDKNKLFSDFIESDDFIIDPNVVPKSNVFIGHTRAGTMGANNLENAHPHIIANSKILAHNGTISNIWELCTKYGVDHSKLHNDSKALGILINKIGFSILNEYVGYAAILYYDEDQPNTMYVYHGASREYSYQQSPLVEERPLFGMLTNEGYYFSSLIDSLMAIRDEKFQQPFKVEVNKVIKIDGVNYGSEVIDIDREWNNCTSQKKTSTTVLADPSGSRKSIMEAYGTNEIEINDETFPFRYHMLNDSQLESDLWVFYHEGRYKNNLEDLLSGEYYINKYGVIRDSKDDSDEKVNVYYFWRGIMLKSKKDYDYITTEVFSDSVTGMMFKVLIENVNQVKTLSKYSKYPVTLYNVYDSVKSTDWWFDGGYALGGFNPKFSDRNYTFKIGSLKSIKSNFENDVIVLDGTNTNIYCNYSEAIDELRNTGSQNISLKDLLSQCRRIYVTESEFNSKVSDVLIQAITEYHVDKMKDTGCYYSIDELDIIVGQFIKSCIANRKSILECLKTSWMHFSTYVKEARKLLTVVDAEFEYAPFEEKEEEDVDDKSLPVIIDQGEDDDNVVLVKTVQGFKTTISVKKKH